MRGKVVRSILIAVVLFFLCGLLIRFVRYEAGHIDLKEAPVTEKQKVYLITKSRDSAFWKSVYSGAGAAGAEYNMDVYYEGPENEEDYKTQNKMIRQAVKDEADAIIFSAVDYEENADAIDQAAKAGVKILVIDSDVNSDKVSCRIGTDNYEAGKRAAEAVLQLSDRKKTKAGIINFDRITENGQSREKGFRENVEKNKKVKIVESVNIPSSVEKGKEAAIKMIRNHPDLDVIIAFNEIISLGVGEAVDELGVEDSVDVVGFDSHVSCIDFLENDVIDALVVQNPYAMGYLSVEGAYRLINGREMEQMINTEVNLVTKSNMYSEKYQRILFAFEEGKE